MSARAAALRGAAPGMSSEKKEDKQETESSAGPGFGALIAGVGALVISAGVAVQPAAASDDGLVRLLKGGSLPQTFGQNNINNGVIDKCYYCVYVFIFLLFFLLVCIYYY